MKIHTETRRYHLKTHLACLECLKVFDRVKRDKLIEILQSKNIPNFLLKHVWRYCRVVLH